MQQARETELEGASHLIQGRAGYFSVPADCSHAGGRVKLLQATYKSRSAGLSVRLPCPLAPALTLCYLKGTQWESQGLPLCEVFTRLAQSAKHLIRISFFISQNNPIKQRPKLPHFAEQKNKIEKHFKDNYLGHGLSLFISLL